MAAIGSNEPKVNLDSIKQLFDSNELNPEYFDKIKQIIDSANSLMTEEERSYHEDKKRREVEAKKQFEDELEKECRKETFQIPRGSGQSYKFIGYTSEQYREIMDVGNQADAMTEEERTKTKAKEWMELVEKVHKLHLKYSLEGMTDDVIDKLPRRELVWLYNVMNKKNFEPLPFVQSG